MIVQISFYDDETLYSEPIFIGEEGKARDHLVREHILQRGEIDELFNHGYAIIQQGEFYWEELS